MSRLQEITDKLPDGATPIIFDRTESTDMPNPQSYSAEHTWSVACRKRETVWIRTKGEVFRKIEN